MAVRLSPEDQEKIIDLHGWHWPLKDKKCWPWLQREKDLPEIISKHCPQKNTVVEAGGNAGFYVKMYANLFENVYTFEPDNLNFRCLTLNVTEKNVIKMQACLGHEKGLVKLQTSNGNIGMYHISFSESGFNKGNIPILRIDDLNLDCCDLIHLDIEGFEFEALKGAINTIKKFQPVIALEWLNHGEKFGSNDDAIEEWLNQLGYESKEKIYHENIFVSTNT